jgi:hypothetical protein
MDERRFPVSPGRSVDLLHDILAAEKLTVLRYEEVVAGE